ncbi:MAG: sugar transferase [Deltaproteobacteria bacterium]|nr:sugar transferase [Deltaproteobacteria bacterium]
MVLKRILDLSLAFVGVIVLSPLFLLCAGLILLESGRPVFFFQERCGRNGKLFRLRKFRTMVPDAEARIFSDPELERLYKQKFKLPEDVDSLITPVGRILRRTSIDELPQLFNVLAGDMSLVGPRPVVPQEIGRYGDLKDKVLSVTPGLSGLWQVSGRNRVDYPQRAWMDVYYIDHQSFWLDVKIILRTVKALLEGSH